jgi:hypothetical protein
MRSASPTIALSRPTQLGLGFGKGRRVILTIVPRRPEKLRMAKATLRAVA